MIEPYLRDPDLVLYNGDALTVLRELPDESAHMVLTSPPFWNLRDYQTGRWEGGEPNCDHVERVMLDAKTPGRNASGHSVIQYSDVCRKCGATRIDEQIGRESTIDGYVENLVGVFRELRRVLRDEGVFWLEVGDMWQSKHLVLAPHRLALALDADGWLLRSECIWHRPNAMTESVTDRPSKAHSTIFMFTKQPRYFYNAEAVAEPSLHAGKFVSIGPKSLSRGQQAAIGVSDEDHWGNANAPGVVVSETRNMRSVWTVVTKPYPETHFAVMAEQVASRCIASACPPGGVVLDPFFGAGTTALVARRFACSTIGIELSPAFCAQAAQRLGQQSLFTLGQDEQLSLA